MRYKQDLGEILRKISVDVSDSILNTLKKMDELGMKLLVVNEEGKFKSLISIGDIQRAVIKGTDLQQSIKGILRDEITICHDDQTDEEIEESMIHNRAEFMPVLDTNNNISRLVFWEDIIHNVDTPSNVIQAPVVIMAGGKGTRLRPLTNIIPKPLIPVGDKPIIEIIMETFGSYGIRKYFVIVNYKASMIKSYIEGLDNKEREISIIKEENEYGTCGSLTMLRGKIETSFFMTNCDTILDQDLSEVYNFHKENSNELTIIGALKHYPIPYGMIEFEEGGKFIGITEKPELTLAVNSGTYILEPHLLEEVPENRFFHITELISNITSRKGKVGVFPVSERSWLDIGEWAEYNRTQQFIAKRKRNDSF